MKSTDAVGWQRLTDEERQQFMKQKIARDDRHWERRAREVVCELCAVNNHKACVKPCICRHDDLS